MNSSSFSHYSLISTRGAKTKQEWHGYLLFLQLQLSCRTIQSLRSFLHCFLYSLCPPCSEYLVRQRDSQSWPDSMQSARNCKLRLVMYVGLATWLLTGLTSSQVRLASFPITSPTTSPSHWCPLLRKLRICKKKFVLPLQWHWYYKPPQLYFFPCGTCWWTHWAVVPAHRNPENIYLWNVLLYSNLLNC